MAMSRLDRLQQAWQSQSCGTIGTNPDLLLKVRLQRRIYFWIDIFLISVSLSVGVLMLRFAFRDIQKGWPWLISVASEVWVVGYILLNRWRRRRNAAHYDEPLLTHVESSIKYIEHQMRLDRNMIWWCILPIFLGCVIPVGILGAMEYSKKPELLIPFVLLLTLGVFAAVFYFVYLVMRYANYLVMRYTGRCITEQSRQELVALRALRESLLNAEE
jgi:hypothetical protein